MGRSDQHSLTGFGPLCLPPSCLSAHSLSSFLSSADGASAVLMENTLTGGQEVRTSCSDPGPVPRPPARAFFQPVLFSQHFRENVSVRVFLRRGEGKGEVPASQECCCERLSLASGGTPAPLPPAVLQSSLHSAPDLGVYQKCEPLLRGKKRIPGNAGGPRGVSVLGLD